MKFLIIIFALVLVVKGSWFPPSNDVSCGLSRADLWNKLIKYGDKNHNGVLEQVEIQTALDTLVPTYIKVLSWMKGMSVTHALDKCDFDKNGIITPHDYEMTKETCFNNLRDRCAMNWFIKKI